MAGERLARLGDALRPLIDGEPCLRGATGMRHQDRDLDALRAGAEREAPALAARLVDEARAATLDVLGGTEGATAIAARRRQAADHVSEASVTEPTKTPS